MAFRSGSLWSRPLALGLGACAACCAPPLIAVVIGAGAAGSVAWLFEPLAAVLLGAAILVGGAAYVRRRGAASCATSAASSAGSCETSCAVGGGCGCASPSRARALGCTLDDDEMPARLDRFRALFARGLVRRRAAPGRAEWIFRWSPALEAEARALAADERACCSFFDFDLARDGDRLRWVTTSTRADAVALLDGVAAAAMTPSPSA